jgi:acyl carrier protein
MAVNRSREDLIELLRETAAALAPSVDPALVVADTDITDLGMDSMQLMEFVAEAEDALGIRIPDAELQDVRTVSDLLDAIARHQRPDEARRS